MSVPAPPSVPGFVLDTLVRFSRSGETWLGRRAADGAPVSLTLVVGALSSAAEPLTTLRHPAAVPVLEIVAAGRCLALVSPPPPAQTLASVCANRPVFDPGEVVGLGVPLARALALAHDRGIVHGDLDPVDIAISDSGQPALIGLGVAALSGAGVAPADDVHALAMILRSLLGDDAGPRAEAIRGALGPALSGHAAARPEADELAGYLSLCCPPQPLRRPATAPSPPPAIDQPRRHGAARRLPSSRVSPTAVTAALAVAGLILLLLAAPLFSSRHRTTAAPVPAGPSATGAELRAGAGHDVRAGTPGPAAPPTAVSGATPAGSATPATTAPVPAQHLSATQWQHTLQRLADQRDQAFATLDAARLAAADAPHSSAAAVDAGRLAQLRAARVHSSGLASTITAVAVTSSGAQAATVTFIESSRSYDLVDATGVVVEHRPASANQRWSVTLVNSGQGWRTAAATAENA